MKPRTIGKRKVQKLLDQKKTWHNAIESLRAVGGAYLHLDSSFDRFFSQRAERTNPWPEGSVLDVNPDHIRQVYKDGNTHFYREFRRTGIFIHWYATKFDSSHQTRYARLSGEAYFNDLDDYLKAIPRIQHRRKSHRAMKELMAHSRRRARRNADRLCKQWRKILDKDNLVGDSMANTLFMKSSNIEDQMLRREILELYGNDIKPYQMQMMGRLSRMQSGRKIEGPSGDFDGE